jgi:hypothetical protein
MNNLAPNETIELQWDYTSQCYFEEPAVLEREGYSIEMSEGHITAKMTADVFDSHPGLRDSLTRQLNDYFLGAQLIRRQPFEIKEGAIVRVKEELRGRIRMVLT